MGKFESREEDMGGTDWRAYFDSSCLRVWHLNGKERTFKIVRVTRLTSEMVSGGKKEVKKQPKLELTDEKGRNVPLPLLLNKTNAQTIARMYGNNPKAWEGKLVTLFPSTTSVGGEDKDCIRVRPKAPTQRKGPKGSDDAAYIARDNQRAEQEEIGLPPQPQREPGDDTDEPPPGALETDHARH